MPRPKKNRDVEDTQENGEDRKLPTFVVSGPHKFFRDEKGGGIDEEKSAEIFEKGGSAYDIAEKSGCYIFAIHRGGKLTPWYVGKATVTFKQEVFTYHKLNNYLEVMNKPQGTKGNLVLIFVCLNRGARGAVNKSAIAKLENYLIEKAHAVNEGIKNKRGRPIIPFEIMGVLPARRGEAKARGVKEFREMLDM